MKLMLLAGSSEYNVPRMEPISPCMKLRPSKRSWPLEYSALLWYGHYCMLYDLSLNKINFYCMYSEN